MDLLVQELNNLLSRKAISMGFELSVKNFTRLAIEELNMSVREFWTCYKSYLIGAFGRDMEYLKIFQNTTMGKIAIGYATLYGKKVLFEEVVRDVIMDIEEYYFSEYGKDISNLQVLIDQFEDPIAFKEDKHGLVILELIQEEASGLELKLVTKWVNDELSPMQEPFLATPMKYERENSEKKELKKPQFENEDTFEPHSSSQSNHITLEERAQLLKERARKLRHLRKSDKPIVVDKKVLVEVDAFGIPNGKGRRKLRHFLSVKTLSAFPTGISESRDLAKKTVSKVVEQAREAFKGDWTVDWASECVRATIRQRKCKTVKQLRCPDGKEDVKSSQTTERFKTALKVTKSSTFMETSRRLKATREKVRKVTHAGRGGFAHITMRYVQEHQEVPASEKVREIADTVAERKMDVE